MQLLQIYGVKELIVVYTEYNSWEVVIFEVNQSPIRSTDKIEIR